MKDEILGVVPARGGSKALPRKNLAPLAGRPLIAWTAEAAANSRRITRVILSTDDEEIAEVGRRMGLEVPFMRPAHLAADDTPITPVLIDLLTTLRTRDGYVPEAVVLLQPTSPLRTAEHIDAAVNLLRQTGADTVVSVIPVPHRFTPGSLMRLDGERLVHLSDAPIVTQRQDKPPLYARNGPAVLVVRSSVLLERGTLYGDDVRPFVMPAEDSIDIDEQADLDIAAWLLRRRVPRLSERPEIT